MNTFERIQYRHLGKLMTVTLRNVSQGAWMLSGTRVDGHGNELPTNLTENNVVIHLTRSLVNRVPMHMNAQGTDLVPTV
jgi:hypothetical protein